jgi:hypothetical protein
MIILSFKLWSNNYVQIRRFTVCYFNVLKPIDHSAPSVALAKPSTPKFTIEEAADFYDVPTTYATDPYTGETIITCQGYRVENTYYALKIKN